MAERRTVVVNLRGGQTIRLPLRRRGRGFERPPEGFEELYAWLDKHPSVVKFAPDEIVFAHIEEDATDA